MFFEPCLPTPSKRVPTGPDWAHEIKHDGYRLIVRRDGDRVRLYTRRGYNWSHRFPLIVDAVRRLKLRSAIIDGEAVVYGTGAWWRAPGASSRAPVSGTSNVSSWAIPWPSTCAAPRKRSAI